MTAAWKMQIYTSLITIKSLRSNFRYEEGFCCFGFGGLDCHFKRKMLFKVRMALWAGAWHCQLPNLYFMAQRCHSTNDLSVWET